MKIKNSYGSKERLFEMMKRVNRLDEQILDQDKRSEIVNDFVNFVNDKLELNDNHPNINLSYDNALAQDMKSYGRYVPETNEILVVAINRNLGDVLRTIAHELVHHKQKLDNRLKPDSGETGSDEENEANSVAGILLRDFGKTNPIIFE